MSRVKAAAPTTGTRTRSISSEPYADELMQSEASTPSAVRLLSFSSLMRSVVRGLPSRCRLMRYAGRSRAMGT